VLGHERRRQHVGVAGHRADPQLAAGDGSARSVRSLTSMSTSGRARRSFIIGGGVAARDQALGRAVRAGRWRGRRWWPVRTRTVPVVACWNGARARWRGQRRPKLRQAVPSPPGDTDPAGRSCW
jgi:hypothetical protein